MIIFSPTKDDILKVGMRVLITRCDIFDLRNRKNRFGKIVRIDGGYIYVRPTYWGKRPPLELYENEFKIVKTYNKTEIKNLIQRSIRITKSYYKKNPGGY